MSSASGRHLQVLVVDDSAVVREVFRQLFAGNPTVTVTTAPDPLIAMRKRR